MLSTNNIILDAIFASLSLGPAMANPADQSAPSLTVPTNITGRTADKFNMGFLGGVGGSSQFQGENSLLPVLPPSTNMDLDHRISASRGLRTGERLLTRFERPNNFNPGLGTDTWREGDNVTWTITNRGEMSDVPSGVAGPLAYKALDRTDRDALAPFSLRSQGLDAVTSAPVVMVTSIAAPTGFTMAEMQQASNQALTRARMSRGLVTRRPAKRARA